MSKYDTMSREDLLDKIEGLEADLEDAVSVALQRGAEDWAAANYPNHPLVTESAGKTKSGSSYQARIHNWMVACFGDEVSADVLERGDRLLEEVFELLQSVNYPRDRVEALEGYVWSRQVGVPFQEVGGVMVTLAAFCEAHALDMAAAGEAEHDRVWTKVDKIRAKQAAKPTGSALPQAWPVARPIPDNLVAKIATIMQQAVAEERNRCEHAVGVSWAPVVGTPYITGPRKFCDAIRALPDVAVDAMSLRQHLEGA